MKKNKAREQSKEYSSIENVNTSSVICYGESVELDHPTIYLRINPALGKVMCPYCSKIFIFSSLSSKIAQKA